MSFTSNAIIRKHLLNSQTPELFIEAQTLNLVGMAESKLPHANLVADSETVKWLVVGRVIAEDPVTVALDKEMQLSSANLVPGSAVVTLSSDLAVLYVEEQDFQMDHQSGTFQALSSGSIPDDTPVLIYYQTYDTFVEGTDYLIDYADGGISRRVGSSIPDGANVLVDYTVSAGSIEDDLIDQAIVEAEDIVLRCLAEGYDETSDDQGIITGATQLALSIVARGMAADVLIINCASDAYNRSKEWQNLSALWERAAWETLGSFLDPHSMNSPVVQ